MTILRQSPWYQEILDEGLEQGREQALERARRDYVLRVLRHRFGDLSEEATLVIERLSLEELDQLFEIALEAPTLEAVTAYLSSRI